MTQFKKGQSGNPKGRPVGVPDKRTELRKRFEVDGNKVAAAVIQAALDGDIQAARLVLERISPPIRAKSEAIEFNLDADASLTDTAKQILTAISEGSIPPDTGKSLLDSVASMARIQEVTELTARIDYLEANIQ